jgi:hypothetical protein
MLLVLNPGGCFGSLHTRKDADTRCEQRVPVRVGRVMEWKASQASG